MFNFLSKLGFVAIIRRLSQEVLYLILIVLAGVFVLHNCRNLGRTLDNAAATPGGLEGQINKLWKGPQPMPVDAGK